MYNLSIRKQSSMQVSHCRHTSTSDRACSGALCRHTLSRDVRSCCGGQRYFLTAVVTVAVTALTVVKPLRVAPDVLKSDDVVLPYRFTSMQTRKHLMKPRRNLLQKATTASSDPY